MTILLTGATGYIGNRLLPVLLEDGHRVICCVRDTNRFDTSLYQAEKLEVIEVNFLEKESLVNIPENIDAAYYLIHSMSSGSGDFEELEKISAQNFRTRIEETRARQVIYLSGIVNDEALSKHLSSRKAVEQVLSEGDFHLTTLRAGIILGSGSASFEIIRDLVEKLPVMVAPRWLNTKSQPIAIRNVIQFLSGVLLLEDSYDRSFDIGGPEVLTYKQMLLKFASVRHLRRYIGVIPLMTPRLSSYWLYFITSTSYKLAVNLVNSMKVEVVCRNDYINELVQVDLLSFEEAVEEAFDPSRRPSYGCFSDQMTKTIHNGQGTYERIRSLQIMEDHQRNPWKIIMDNPVKKYILLSSEKGLPGEAWLEFEIEDETLLMTSVFRPLGLKGRIYWYITRIFRNIESRKMINRIAVA
jgi:uncharacterized protein YbjT (DUF2867 family)